MNTRERTHDDRERPAMQTSPTGQSGVRAAAERLLARGGDALDRTLSQNSEEFLAANRQEGGQ